MVARQSICLRRLSGGERAREVGFGRFLANEKVTVERLIAGWSAQTSSAVADRHVLAIQDTSEINFLTTPERRRGLGEVRKVIFLLSLMARPCRSATAEDVCALQPAIKRSTVTFSLARNRPKPTSRARSPPLSRRRQMLWRATMSPSSAAPFYRAGGLGTHPTTDCHSTLRHPESVRSVTERITDQPLPASHNRTPSQSAAPPRSVHAVVAKRGRGTVRRTVEGATP